MRLRTIAASLALLGLCQCSPAKPTPKLPPQPLFDVNVDITAEGIQTLQSADDHAVVDVYYYGFPKPGESVEIDQIGRVRLGNDLFPIKATDKKIRVQPTDIDPALLTKVVEPYAQITIYSRTKEHGADEKLDCNSYHGSLVNAAKTGVTVTCDVNRGPD